MFQKILKGHKIGMQATKVSHLSVFDAFEDIKFIVVGPVRPPANEVVNGQLNCNLAAL